MGKLFSPPDMQSGTITHEGKTFEIIDGAIDDVPSDAARVFIESHGFTGSRFVPPVQIVERVVELQGPERIVEKLVERQDDDDPNKVPELKIDEMKRGELFAALRGLGVVCVPPITNEELRENLRKAVAARSKEELHPPTPPQT